MGLLYACTYVCMYIHICICMNVGMYVCMCVCMRVYTCIVRMYVCLNVSMYSYILAFYKECSITMRSQSSDEKLFRRSTWSKIVKIHNSEYLIVPGIPYEFC